MSADDHDSYQYFEDGALTVENGHVVSAGDYAPVEGAQVVDHRPHLIMPGFIDPHIHYPQMQVVGSYAAALLDWLNNYTFIEEQRFGDGAHAARIASLFFDELLRNGTTTAVAFSTVHKASGEAFFSEAMARNLRMITGKVMMDAHAPDGLLDNAQSSYDDSLELLRKWHGKDRLSYAISPRFALTSTPEQMEAAGALYREHPDCYLQTHLSENDAEIARAMELYPDAKDYTDIYAKHGHLGPKSLMGHAIHLSDREMDVMVETGAVAVSCPTSNLFLGSGLFPREALQRAGVRTAFASDIGGGTSYSMLRTMDEAYKIQQLLKARFSPLQTFHAMTLGNAEALSLSDKIGCFKRGSEADFVVLDAKATPAMALKMECVETLSEELFLLQTLGDDRSVAETYVMGEAVKSKLPQ